MAESTRASQRFFFGEECDRLERVLADRIGPEAAELRAVIARAREDLGSAEVVVRLGAINSLVALQERVRRLVDSA